MVDWLFIWGASQIGWLLFKPVLEELAKDATKDWVKDWFKGCLNDVIPLPKMDVLKMAAGKASKEFLVLMQEQLEDGDLSEDEIKTYLPAMKRFMSDETTLAILGEPFGPDCDQLNYMGLARIWSEQNAKDIPENLALPDNFDWGRIGKRYVRKVTDIRQADEELQKILAAQSQRKAANSLQEIQGIKAPFDLVTYQESLLEQYQHLKLESLDTSGYAYNELKLWRMFIAQDVRACQEFSPKVYELPKELRRKLKEKGEIELELDAETEARMRQAYVDQSPKPVLEVIREESSPQRLVILGDPGSGKSTLLQYLALDWAEKATQELFTSTVPLLIELRLYARNRKDGTCKTFLEFLNHGTGLTYHLNQRELHQALSAGQIIALFDGLDEIFNSALREEVKSDVHRFSNEYPLVSIVVTSRWLGYKAQKLRDAEFQHFMLQDLDDPKIQNFITRWHNLTFPEGNDRIRKRTRLERGIFESRPIRELAGNPLLLTMMAILNRNQELPRDRPELYNQASRVLLHQWDVERTLIEDPRLDPKTIDYKDKQSMLRQIAFHMQQSQVGLTGNLIQRTELEKILKKALSSIEVPQPKIAAKALLEQLRSRNFILCFLGAESYAFVHRTFLEYFCAWAFVWKFKETQTLKFNELQAQVFDQHWDNEVWHEVLLLICGMLDTKFTGKIIDFLINKKNVNSDYRSLFLAAECLNEVRNRSQIQDISGKIFSELESLITGNIDIKDNEFSDFSKSDYELWIKIKAINSMLATFQKRKKTLVVLKKIVIQEENNFLSNFALEKISESYHEDQEVLKWFKDLVVMNTNDERNAFGASNSTLYLSINDQAAIQIAKFWNNIHENYLWLHELATRSEEEFVRKAAIRGLATGWKNIPDTILLLRDIALNSKNIFLRQVAIDAIASSWKDEQAEQKFCMEIARNDESEKVRAVALRGLSDFWIADPETKLWLKELISNETSEFIRSASANRLQTLYQGDTTVINFIKDHNLYDPFLDIPF